MTEFVEKTLNWSLGVSFQTAGSGHLRMEPWAFCWVWCIQMPRVVSFMVLRRVARAMFDMHCYFTNVWDWVKSFAWKHGESPTGSCFQTLMQRWAASFLVIREISCTLDQADLLLCKCGVVIWCCVFTVYRTSCSSFQPYNSLVIVSWLNTVTTTNTLLGTLFKSERITTETCNGAFPAMHFDMVTRSASSKWKHLEM